MLQITGLKVNVDALDGSISAERAAATKAALKRLHVASDQLRGIELRRRSVDARKGVQVSYTVRVSLVGGANQEVALLGKLKKQHRDKGISQCTADEQHHVVAAQLPGDGRVVVVGAGCAGLFCALELARAGLEPLLVERGDDAKRRSAQVSAFDAGAPLDPESNIQFGMGGAGTFSDGKLATGTKSKLHRSILEQFVELGASPAILFDAHPHIGSDVLPGIVDKICTEIEQLGGTVRTRTKLVGLDIAQGHLRGCHLESHSGDEVRHEYVPTHHVVLATGHSARDVFEMLAQNRVPMERKTFAVGVRIEHLQADVDRAQYGRYAGHPALGAAPYKVVSHISDTRSAFSFCMCPGGFVVAATSEENAVVTNGMSLADRAGTNANAGYLSNVYPDDLPGNDVLAGMRLQEELERRAFDLGGGSYSAPAQLVSDFLQQVPSSGPGTVLPTYPRGVTWGSVSQCLPEYVEQTLRAALPRIAKHFSPYGIADAVLTGVESRSSSPVRVVRNEHCESIGVEGLWLAGEGAGYAGGIMSAATDGIRVADALINTLEPRQGKSL